MPGAASGRQGDMKEWLRQCRTLHHGQLPDQKDNRNDSRGGGFPKKTERYREILSHRRSRECR